VRALTIALTMTGLYRPNFIGHQLRRHLRCSAYSVVGTQTRRRYTRQVTARAWVRAQFSRAPSPGRRAGAARMLLAEGQRETGDGFASVVGDATRTEDARCRNRDSVRGHVDGGGVQRPSLSRSSSGPPRSRRVRFWNTCSRGTKVARGSRRQ
jgi:hypothetical protein